MSDAPNPPATPDDPGYSSVREYLLYSLSLPERTLRSASGLLGGALRESASLLVPQAFRSSKTYAVMVQQMLDFLAEDVGRVARPATAAAPQVENFVARKAVSSFVDMAGMATFHLSPLLLLALVNDLAYGSRAYLQELASELKQDGVIAADSTIDRVDDLLAALGTTADTMATAFNMPPLSLEGLKQTVEETRRGVSSLDPTQVLPQAELTRLWDEIHQTAAREGVRPLAVSSAMTLASLQRIGALGQGALSTVRVAGTLLERHVWDYYRQALGDIHQRGYYRALADASKPYAEAVWSNFSLRQTTLTEDLFSGKLLAQAWGTVRRWLGRTP